MRVLGWNALLLAAGVAMVVLAGEAYLRLTTPFIASRPSLEFVPNVGYLWPPNTEIGFTNNLDYWNVSRTNSLGFLDREPPAPERAKATCHISIIGDSFVAAQQVPIEDKLQVRLEELAATRLPHLDVTTSAFGLSGTGQVHQLPFYDQYARRLHPRLLVLVFVYNDFYENTPFMRAIRMQLVTRTIKGNPPLEPIVRKRPDGELKLAWPPKTGLAARAGRKATHYSLFARWLLAKMKALFPRTYSLPEDFDNTLKALRRKFGMTLSDIRLATTQGEPPPFFEDIMQYTRFALKQFKQRADRDGAALAILIASDWVPHGTRAFEGVSKMAATLGIPVIDQVDYILRQGADLSDAQWLHDTHWTPAGHQWAAEALLEYIEQRPEVCDL